MWKVVLENLIPLLFTLATPIVLMLVNRSLKALAKKWDLEDALKYDDKVDELVLKGIKAVEQKSLAAVKKGADRTAGEEKLDQAMKFVNAQLQAMNLPEKGGDELAMLIESKLFDGAKEKKELPAAEEA